VRTTGPGVLNDAQVAAEILSSTREEAQMGDEAEDGVRLEADTKAKAIQFIKCNITREASSIEVTKHSDDDGYTCIAFGFPEGED